MISVIIIILVIMIIVIVFLLMKRKKKSMVQQMPHQEIQPAQPENAVPQHHSEQSQIQYNNLYQQSLTYSQPQVEHINQETQSQKYDFNSENQR
jgi:hypothetical protein